MAVELDQWQNADTARLGCAVRSMDDFSGFLTWWHVEGRGNHGEHMAFVQCLAFGANGERYPAQEKHAQQVFNYEPIDALTSNDERKSALANSIEPALRRSMEMRGIAANAGGYETKLIGFIEVV